jgi:glycosyltransferase involved in cell wall biosynthesis
MIPTYNRAGWLEEAIESSLSQDYPNLEIVVSDNNSTDSTPEVVRKYFHDKRFKYYRNEPPISPEANWAKLLYNYAVGIYGKLLCDDDCIIKKDHIRESVCLMLENELNIVFSGSLLKYEDEINDNKDLSINAPKVIGPEWWLNNLGTKQKGKTVFPNLATASVFNLEKARSLNAFYPPIFGFDYELLLKFVLVGKSGYLSGLHCMERAHNKCGGKTYPWERAYEATKMFLRVYEFGIKIGIEEKKMERFTRRALRAFSRNFLVNKWLSEKGGSLWSLTSFYREMSRIDPVTFWRILRFPTICKMILFNNRNAYNLIRKIYWVLRHWKLPPAKEL